VLEGDGHGARERARRDLHRRAGETLPPAAPTIVSDPPSTGPPSTGADAFVPPPHAAMSTPHATSAAGPPMTRLASILASRHDETSVPPPALTNIQRTRTPALRSFFRVRSSPDEELNG
jgi:hypothetical protein